MPTLERPKLDTVTYAGWLLKKGGVNPAFKHRYFRLAGTALYYYGDARQTHPKGMIDLEGAIVDPAPYTVGSQQHCFRLSSLSTSSFKTLTPRRLRPEYILAARSADGARAWIRAICAALGYDPGGGARPGSRPPGIAAASSTEDVSRGRSASDGPPSLATSRQASRPESDYTPVTTERESSGRKFLKAEGAEFELLEKLGEGATCKVKRAVDTATGAQFAVKILKKTSLKKKRHFVHREKRHMSEYDNVVREIAIMKKLRHENVVRLHEVYDDDERDRLYLVLDLLAGGPVGPSKTTIEPLPLPELRRCLRDTVAGLEYLHFQNVAHRDLKPANIMRTADGDGCRYLIGDFGVSLLFEDGDDATTGNVGTLPFKPPEAHDAQGGQFSGKKADVWSLGVTVFQLAYGQLPFAAEDPFELAERIVADPVVFPADLGDRLLEDLLKRLLAKRPEDRPDISEVRQHPWLRAGDAVDSALAAREPALAPAFTSITVTSDDVHRAFQTMHSFRVDRAGADEDDDMGLGDEEDEPPPCDVRFAVDLSPAAAPTARGEGVQGRSETDPGWPRVMVSLTVDHSDRRRSSMSRRSA